MKKPELLSPVGNIECLYAAIEGGCDAVYLGGYTFGARNYALNFSNEEIITAINYAHLYGVKVYITVNTLIYEDEVDMFLSYVDFLHKNNVDAVIIQDIGMMDLVRKTYPNLEIHASTQMHIHNLEGAKFLENLGIKRTVIARETNIDSLKEIKKSTNIDIEVFVHGALCISYSGQCLMSSMMGDRSGNKGTCSQCCRMKYDVISDDKKVNNDIYNLSTKDLCTIDKIGELIEIGIDSFKIEGRMKRPEYVYYVTKLYRKAIDEYFLDKKITINENELDILKKLFNREFTKGFLFNEDNINFTNNKRPNHIGIEIGKIVKVENNYITCKLSKNVNQGDGIRIIGNNDSGCILNKIYQNGKLVNGGKIEEEISFYLDSDVKVNDLLVITSDKENLDLINKEIKNKSRKVNITGTLIGTIGQPLKLVLNDYKNTVEIESDFLIENANNCPLSHDRIKEQIEKLGNTIYKLNNLELKLDDNIFIKIQDINELRRQAVLKLNEIRLYKIEYKKSQYTISLTEEIEEPGYTYEINDIKEIDKLTNYKQIYCDKVIDKTVLKLPKVMNEFENQKNPLLVSEIGSLKYKPFYTDYSFNVVNSYSVAFFNSLNVKRVTLSLELDDNKIEQLITAYIKRYNKSPNLELIVSSYPEVMVSKFNLKKYYNLKDTTYLRNELNKLFLVKEKDNLTYIYHFEKIEKENHQQYFKMGINTLRIIV